MKLLRRQVLCREEDFIRHIRPQCQAVGYDRWYWEPVLMSVIAENITLQILKTNDWEWSTFYSRREEGTYVDYSPLPPSVNDAILARQYISFLQSKGLLYEARWKNWSWKFEDDHIWLRYFSSKSWKMMGMATVERDY